MNIEHRTLNIEHRRSHPSPRPSPHRNGAREICFWKPIPRAALSESLCPGLLSVTPFGVSGPWVGAALFTWLQDTVARQTDYWRALLGIVMLALVLVFPLGVAGGLKRIFIRDASA